MPAKSVSRTAKRHDLVLSVIVGCVLLLAGLGAVLLLAAKSQDLRQQAASEKAYYCTSVDQCMKFGYNDCNLDSHTCSYVPTPSPALGSCGAGFRPVPSCASLTGANCGGYQTCHRGQNYSATKPIVGSNICTYTVDGRQCNAACPSTVGRAGLSRCQCGNGIWTIGKIPAGGSCETLCACTGNKLPR